jgi:tetratricopeptide (TPR) repeat protein
MSENLLIQKQYYENYMKDNELAHPIRVLGDYYRKEQQNELPDLAGIRFAQGEVYFHHKDYEAAIFKWEHIHSDLEPWAKKNIADSMFQLELYQEAEERYKSINSDSVLLNTEIGMQLFALYTIQGNMEAAFKVIKKVVALNPGYSNVTKMARDFYEKQGDWQCAAELAASEANRTESLSWFDDLYKYIENGYTKGFEPTFFINVLRPLYKLDRNRFEDMLILIYENCPNKLTWQVAVNSLITELAATGFNASDKMMNLFNDTYHHLLDGSYLLSELHPVIPVFLDNWLKISQSLQAVTAILAWNDLFPASLESNLLQEALYYFQHNHNQLVSEKEILLLVEAIFKWAETNGIHAKGYIAEVNSRPIKEDAERLLSTIRNLIKELSEKRAEVDQQLMVSIRQMEELVAKINGASHQLEDLEEEKIKSIQLSFLECKEVIKEELTKKIPTLFKNCSDMITEDSDFTILKKVLEDEMNKRLQSYLEEAILPNFYELLGCWLEFSTVELKKCQAWLQDRSEGFQALFGEKWRLDCDFKIVEDWQRDITRMTSGHSVEDVTIFSKLSPKLFIFSSAGKILGSYIQSYPLLYNKCKTFIETESYQEVTEEIVKKFLLQFDLFEKGLERDLKLFFKQPYQVMSEKLEEMERIKQQSSEELTMHKEQPELFQDPITIFSLRLRQFEWMQMVGENTVSQNN